MAGGYRTFSKAQFEYFLTKTVKENELGYWRSLTEDLERETSRAYWEHVYQMATLNRTLTILIYSSVDRRFNKTRDLGKDAVRIVYRWETEKGVLYAKLKTHYRVNGLEKNLETTLKRYSNKDIIFNLLDKKINLKWKRTEAEL